MFRFGIKVEAERYGRKDGKSIEKETNFPTKEAGTDQNSMVTVAVGTNSTKPYSRTVGWR